MVSERERKKKGADGISEWVTGNNWEGRERERERERKGEREGGRKGGRGGLTFTALTSQSICTIVVHT